MGKVTQPEDAFRKETSFLINFVDDGMNVAKAVWNMPCDEKP